MGEEGLGIKRGWGGGGGLRGNFRIDMQPESCLVYK